MGYKKKNKKQMLISAFWNSYAFQIYRHSSPSMVILMILLLGFLKNGLLKKYKYIHTYILQITVQKWNCFGITMVNFTFVKPSHDIQTHVYSELMIG